MTEKEYRQHPAISRSELWRMHESPEKFKYFRDNPPETTPALLFGQVVHKMLLQPESFDSEFVVAPDIDRRTKAGKAEWANFVASITDQQIITMDVYEQAKEMVSAVKTAPMVEKLLTGQKEVPFFWTDEDTGEQCKLRCDCLTMLNDDGIPTIIDYKTASCAETNAFLKDFYKYGYHFQAAMYSEGVMRAMELTERPDFVFVVQEKKPPYSVNVVEVSEDVMTYGIDVFRELIGKYHACKETGYWYGYMGPFGEPNETFLPGWYTLGQENDEEVEDDT